MDIRRVAVAGTGMMGPGIAAVFALAGCEATIVSRSSENAARGIAKAQGIIDQLVANGLAEPTQGTAAKARLQEGRTRRRRRRPPSCLWSRSPSTWRPSRSIRPTGRRCARHPALLQHLGHQHHRDRRQVPQARTGHDHPLLEPAAPDALGRGRDGAAHGPGRRPNRRRPLAGCRQGRGARTEGPARATREPVSAGPRPRVYQHRRGRDRQRGGRRSGDQGRDGPAISGLWRLRACGSRRARSREGRPGLRPTRPDDHQIRGPLLEQKVAKGELGAKAGKGFLTWTPRRRIRCDSGAINSSYSSCGGKRRGKSGRCLKNSRLRPQPSPPADCHSEMSQRVQVYMFGENPLIFS